MRYLDTSVVIGIFADEPRRAELEAWLEANGDFAISWWNGVEFASAISRKVRERRYSAVDAEILSSTYDQLVVRAFRTLPVGRDDLSRARAFTATPHAALRASDALHLAVAAAHGLELVTLDKRMASGGAAVGVATLLL